MRFQLSELHRCSFALHSCKGFWRAKDSIGLIKLECVTGDLVAASSAAIDIAEQTPEQLQPFLLPAVMPLPGMAEQVFADWHQQLQERLMFPPTSSPACFLQ